MTIADIKSQTEQKMSKAIEALITSLGKIRTGRAHIGLLDHVQVDYYGSMVPISQVSNVTLIDSRTIGVTPFEKRLGQAIDKAIRESDLGLNPSMIGELIRVPMPALSSERRKELIKIVKTDGESSKVVVRNLRRDANNGFKELVKNKLASEDEDRKAQDDIQKFTDRFIVEIDKLLVIKEQELMTI